MVGGGHPAHRDRVEAPGEDQHIRRARRVLRPGRRPCHDRLGGDELRPAVDHRQAAGRRGIAGRGRPRRRDQPAEIAFGPGQQVGVHGPAVDHGEDGLVPAIDDEGAGDAEGLAQRLAERGGRPAGIGLQRQVAVGLGRATQALGRAGEIALLGGDHRPGQGDGLLGGDAVLALRREQDEPGDDDGADEQQAEQRRRSPAARAAGHRLRRHCRSRWRRADRVRSSG